MLTSLLKKKTKWKLYKKNKIKKFVFVQVFVRNVFFFKLSKQLKKIAYLKTFWKFQYIWQTLIHTLNDYFASGTLI